MSAIRVPRTRRENTVQQRDATLPGGRPGSRPGPHMDQNVLVGYAAVAVPSIYSSARTELDRSPVCRHHACMISSFVRALISARRVPKKRNQLQAGAPGRFGLEVVWSKYSNAQRVSSLHLSKGCLNLASRSDTYFFRVRSSLPAARPAADLSQPCAPPVGLSPATRSPGVGSQSCGAKYPGFFADSKGV